MDKLREIKEEKTKYALDHLTPKYVNGKKGI